VADLVAEGVEPTVPANVRETVEMVAHLIAEGATEVTQAQLRNKLGLDRGPTSRRVANAAKRGYLRNEEERKGKPSRLIIGDPMPEEIDLLPTPEALTEALLHRCAVDGEKGLLPTHTVQENEIQHGGLPGSVIGSRF